MRGIALKWWNVDKMKQGLCFPWLGISSKNAIPQPVVEAKLLNLFRNKQIDLWVQSISGNGRAGIWYWERYWSKSYNYQEDQYLILLLRSFFWARKRKILTNKHGGLLCVHYGWEKYKISHVILSVIRCLSRLDTSLLNRLHFSMYLLQGCIACLHSDYLV